MAVTTFRVDKQTATLILTVLGLGGGGAGVTKIQADIADIRERVARVETMLEQRAVTAEVSK